MKSSIEEQFNKSFEILETFEKSDSGRKRVWNEEDWIIIQTNYENYCKTFSPLYLSGCLWYKHIGNDFRSAYYNNLISSKLKK